MSVRDYLSTFPDTVVAYSGEDVSLHVQALIGWLVLDSAGRSVNVVNIGLMPQVERLLDAVERLVASKRLYLLILASNKPNSFIAGADILAMFPNTEQSAATAGSQALQSVVNRVEQLPVPTIAAINGPALGAGLELALACDYRLASSDSRVVLGLPEVKLGLLPGSGGTVRLPELLGLREALPVLLQGGNVRTDRAVRIGLLDSVIETGDRVEGEHRFWSGVRAFATQQMGKGKRRAGGRLRKAAGGVKERLMDGTWAGQWMVATMAARSLDKETRGRYPAPYFALDSAVQSAGGLSRKQALELEANYFGKLAVTPESKALMSLFFLMEEAKKRKEKTGNAPIIRISKVAVIGAGVMGGQIAALLASKRLSVYIRDIQQAAVDAALQQVQRTFQSRVSKGRLKAAQAAQLTALVTGGTELQPLSQVDLVVEAAVEILELKKRILRECEAVMPPRALFATNTSSLSITELAAVSTRPQQVLGLHFFNPVQRMPLVEIIRHGGTAASAVASAYQHVLDIGKIPVICNDGPGFVVNRILGIYMTEAGHLVMEGATVKQVDDAMLSFGLPLGPFRLMDEVGLDVVQHVAPVLEAGLGPRFRPVPEFSELLKANPKMLGKKTGSGFYLYDEDGKERGLNPLMAEQIEAARAKHKQQQQAAGSTIAPPSSSSSSSSPPSAAPSSASASSPLPLARSLLPPSILPSSSSSATLIVDRCVLLMVNEAAHLLSSSVVASPSAVDLAMITGAGFPPFTGGLLSYADSRGAEAVVGRLQVLRKAAGERFAPAPLLVSMAENGERFFPERPDPRRLRRVDALPRSRL